MVDDLRDAVGRLGSYLREATENDNWKLIDPWLDIRLVGKLCFGAFTEPGEYERAIKVVLLLGIICLLCLVALVHRVRRGHRGISFGPDPIASTETTKTTDRQLMFLTFDHVTKFYGPVIGVNDVSCRIGPGITGLLGSNGAGKSTLMKLASGQLRPHQGAVRIGTADAWSTAAKRLFRLRAPI